MKREKTMSLIKKSKLSDFELEEWYEEFQKEYEADQALIETIAPGDYPISKADERCCTKYRRAYNDDAILEAMHRIYSRSIDDPYEEDKVSEIIKQYNSKSYWELFKEERRLQRQINRLEFKYKLCKKAGGRQAEGCIARALETPEGKAALEAAMKEPIKLHLDWCEKIDKELDDEEKQ